MVSSASVQSCQDIDRCPFLEEIQHHLPSDFFGICTDSFVHDAVIRSKYICSLFQRPINLAVPDGNESRGNILKPAQAAQRLCQIVEM